MDFHLTKEHEDLKQQFDSFFREEMKIAPEVYHHTSSLEAIYSSDEGWEFHRYMQGKLAEKGWLTLAWPREYGGREASHMDQLLFEEVRTYHRAPGVDVFGLRMFAPTLLAFASEDQKRRLLPPIARGEVNYCQGWSEPNAGSDLASLNTRAQRKGDRYIINGQKIWTTGAHRASHIFLLARTDPTKRRSAGLSVFNIRMDTPGIEVRPIRYMNGAHLYNEIYFTDVEVPEEDRIGPENEGWKLTRATMNFERSNVRNFSEVRRFIEELLDYVRETKRDGRPLIEHPATRRRLAKLFVDTEVGRTLAYKVCWLQEKGELISSAAAASESKVFGSELIQRMANYATEIMGLYGQLEESPWAPLGGAMVHFYQWCMGANIAAGTSEIQRNLIAWVGVGLPRAR